MPAWATTEPDEDVNLFHRSAYTYVNAAADAEREREKKSTRRQQQKSKRCSDGYRSSKRQQFSDDEDDNEFVESDHNSDRTSHGEVRPSALQHHCEISSKPQSFPIKSSLVQQYEEKVTASNLLGEKKRYPLPVNITYSKDDSAEKIPLPIEKCAVELDSIKTSPIQMEEHSSFEEEFPELARKARDKARQKRLEQDIRLSPQIHRSNSNNEPFSASKMKLQPTSPPPFLLPEPALHILITSALENTQPLIVTRRLSQRLKDVRLAWAERQQLSESLIDTVFLTWRGKRLFDVTSCKSLGITVDASGLILFKGDVLGDKEGRLHMEAMTPEILERSRRAKKDAQNGEADDKNVDEAHCQLSTKVTPQARIVLKGQGFDDFKLIVKPVSLLPLAPTRIFLHG